MARFLELLAGLAVMSKGKCVFCRRDIPDDGEVCADCRPKRQTLLQTGFWGNTLTVYQYDGIIRRLIHNFKYNDMPFLGRYIAGEMCACLKEWPIHADMITFVPIHDMRRSARGFDQSEMLAELIGAETDIWAGRLLSRIKNTPPQYNLSKELRKKNIKGAFRLEGNLDLQGKRIILVDDILTTGATMAECAAVLEKAGALVVPFAFARENLFD